MQDQMLNSVHKEHAFSVVVQQGVHGQVQQHQACPEENLAHGADTVDPLSAHEEVDAHRKTQQQRRRKLPRDQPTQQIHANNPLESQLRHEDLVKRIIDRVVQACAVHNVPVTLKTRTGWDQYSRNAVRIATLAESLGIAALTLHGRTRADLYEGQAEYDTIKAVKAAIKIPVIANGDIDSPEKARQVLAYSGADAVMIGRAAMGRPWLFREVDHYLRTGETHRPITLAEIRDHLLTHLDDHYRFYGETVGVRTARKHIGWYMKDLPGGQTMVSTINAIDSTAQQAFVVSKWFNQTIADAPDLLENKMAA